MNLAGCCGAECGIDIAGATPPAGHDRHWSAVGSAATISATNAIARTAGLSSFRFAPAGAFSYLEKTEASGLIQIVLRLAFYFDTLPTVDAEFVRISATAGEAAGLKFLVATQEVQGIFLSAGTPTANYAVVAGRWYVADFYADFTKSPRLLSVQIMDDTTGVITDLGTASRSTAAATITTRRMGLGTLSTSTVDGIIHIDDLAWSFDPADYPIGNGYVVPLRPEFDGIHVVSASGNFKIGPAGTAINGTETVLNGNVQDADLTVSTNYLEQAVIAATDYLEFLPHPLDNAVYPPDSIPRCVQAAVRMQNNSLTTANTITFRVLSGPNSSDVVANASLGATTGIYMTKAWARDFDGTSPLTWAVIGALKFRFGFSNDVTPLPDLHGFLLEVEYAPAPSVSVSLGGAVAAGIPETDVVPGGDTVTLTLTGGTWPT